MSHFRLSVTLALLTSVGLLLLLALEAMLTAAGQRKPAAVVTGLSVVAALALLLQLVLLASRLLGRLRETALWRRARRVGAGGVDRDAGRSDTKRPSERSVRPARQA